MPYRAAGRQLAEFTLIGRIGKITPSHTVPCRSIAANHRRKGKDGDWGDDSHWNQWACSRSVHPVYRAD